jgi:hypothetical protein
MRVIIVYNIGFEFRQLLRLWGWFFRNIGGGNNVFGRLNDVRVKIGPIRRHGG